MASPGAVMHSDSAEAILELATIVEAAEALEAQGKFREAAELTAKALNRTHATYVKSKVPGVRLVRQPTVAMPRHSYVERYKARLRVDWQKWERCSRRAAPAVNDDDSWDGDEEEEEEEAEIKEGEPPAAAAASSSAALTPRRSSRRVSNAGAMQPAASVSGGFQLSGRIDEAADWEPETLHKSATPGSDGQIAISHTCTDGSKVVALTMAQPELPPRAANMFNREQKRTVRSLLTGDADLCSRAYTHEEVAQWLLTAEKLSKNRIGDYLGRADDDAVRTLEAFLAPLDFSPFTFDEALRFFLSLFRLPGEAQQIDRIMQRFAERYHVTNPGTFRSADTP